MKGKGNIMSMKQPIPFWFKFCVVALIICLIGLFTSAYYLYG
ncbi:hypothetical protein [Inovirus D_HF3_10]|nr:hypothetical protein [Inovirus D_HF3_10]